MKVMYWEAATKSSGQSMQPLGITIMINDFQYNGHPEHMVINGLKAYMQSLLKDTNMYSV